MTHIKNTKGRLSFIKRHLKHLTPAQVTKVYKTVEKQHEKSKRGKVYK